MRTLRITNEPGSQYYDLVNGPVRATLNEYFENVTGDGRLERRYSLQASTDRHTRLEIMEAFKLIEAIIPLAEKARDKPFEGPSWWLEEGAEDEVPHKRAVIEKMSIKRRYVPGMSDPLLTHDYLVGELVIVTKIENESGIRHVAIDATGVSVLGGMVTFGGGGTQDGRVERLTIEPQSGLLADSVNHAWVGIRPENAGLADFNPVLSLSEISGTLPTGLSLVADTDAVSGYALQISHNTVATPNVLTDRFWTAISLSHFPADYSHWNGRYRGILRYKIVGITAQIAIQFSYGNAFLNERRRMDMVYLTGTNDVCRYVDIGEINLPFFGSYPGKVVEEINGSYDCSFVYATEFIDGNPSIDHLKLLELILMPADRLGTCTDAPQISGLAKINWLTNEFDQADVIGERGLVIDGQNTLSLPQGGGALVVLVESVDEASKTDLLNITMAVRHRYGRYAGNG